MNLTELKNAIDAEFDKIRAEIKRILGGSSHEAPAIAVVDDAHTAAWIAASDHATAGGMTDDTTVKLQNEVVAHAETADALDAERAAHEATKQDLADALAEAAAKSDPVNPQGDMAAPHIIGIDLAATGSTDQSAS